MALTGTHSSPLLPAPTPHLSMDRAIESPRPLARSPPPPPPPGSVQPNGTAGALSRASLRAAAVPVLGAAEQPGQTDLETPAAELAGPRRLPPPSPALQVQSADVARRAALSATAAQATAVVAAGLAGRVAASRSRTASRRQTRGIGTLEADLHAGVSAWTGGGSRRATNAYLPAVPLQLLQSEATDRETLAALCAERTMPAGEDDSLQSLKASLLRFNASSSTVKGARMLAAMVHVRGEAQNGRQGLADYQAVVAHPVGVGVDGATGPSAADARRLQGHPLSLLGEAPAPPAPLSPASTVVQTPGAAARSVSGVPPYPTQQRTATPSFPPAAGEDARRTASPSPIPRGHAPSSPSLVPPTDGTAVPRSDAPRRRSLVHASNLVQAMLEEAERVDTMATAAGLADVKDLLHKVYDRVNSHANSQAAANSRTDTALGSVLKGQADVVAASLSAAVPKSALRRPGGVQVGRQTKRAKGAGALLKPAMDPTGGGAVVSTPAPDTERPGSGFKYPLVDDWGMPVEMMSQRFITEPLFLQLANLVRMCHVSVDHPGIFGSFACAQLYEMGLERSTEALGEGRAAAAANAVKMERMRGIIKNKAKKYIVMMGWLHGVIPEVFRPPQAASYEGMKSFFFDESNHCPLLLAAINSDADDLGWATDHTVRRPTAARINQLHSLVQSKGKRGGGGAHTTAAGILDSSPFKELFATALKNVEAKYGRVE